MPGVEWRTYIKNSIDNLAAVVVLWTETSVRSESVMSEALQAVKQDKLVNSLHGITQPPYPFHEINGAGLDSWEAGLPHAGWEKLIATLDALIAAKHGERRPGGLIAAYRSQLIEVKQRKAELKTAEGEGAKRLRARTKAVKDCATAQHRVERFDVQLGELKALNVSKKTLVAAMDELEEAQGQSAAAQQQLAELDDSNEHAEFQLQGMRDNLNEYLVSIGGSGDAENTFLTPQPVPSEVADFAEPEPEPVPEIKPQPVPARPQVVAEPAAAAADSAPATFAAASTNRSRQASPPTFLQRNRMLKAAGLVVVAILLALALRSGPTPDAGPQAEEAAPAASASAPPNIIIDVTQTPLDAAKAKLGWLLADNWGFGGKCGAEQLLPIGLSDDGKSLLLGVTARRQSFAIQAIDAGKSVTTKENIYKSTGPTSMRVTGRKSGQSAEYSKCDP